MIPIERVKEIILQHTALEKELSSGNLSPKLFAKKSKEYSILGNIISVAKEYVNFENEKKDLEQILHDKSNDLEMIEMAEKDLEDIPDHIKKDLVFHFAKEMMDVIKVAVPGLNLKFSRKNTRAKTKK